MTTPSVAAVERQLRSAFASVEPPPPWALVDGEEGDEPLRVAKAFKGRKRWAKVPAKVLDEAPDGLASALSFFSDEAFRFFLPAYLVADVRGRLERVDPVFHLTQGLTKDTRDERINPRRYGERTWLDAARYRFSVFTKPQAAAIVGYLRLRAARASVDRKEIEQALACYWTGRADPRARRR